MALASNHAQREIFVFDQVSAKVTFLSDSGRFITQISTKLKSDLTGMVHFFESLMRYFRLFYCLFSLSRDFFMCSYGWCENIRQTKWTEKAPDCKSLVYSSNELYLLDSPNNCIKIFAKGKQWSYFRSICPSGMHVSTDFYTDYSTYPPLRHFWWEPWQSQALSLIRIVPRITISRFGDFKFQEMRGLALSPDNNLYISNCWSHSILRVHKKSADTTLLADRKLAC